MESILRTYLRFVDRLNKVMGYILTLLLAIMTALIFWQVFSRFVVGSSLSWSEELSRFLMIFMIMIGASIALRHNELIAIEILLEKVENLSKKVVVITIHIISIVFFVILIKYGYSMAQSFSNQLAPGLGLSMKYIYLALPLGGILLLLNSLACIVEEIIGKGEK
ncbi:TRAP transporter small permease [Psychrobacillus soli]|uniref:TRAP transporter small permease n=1 Tax=Psychrobacillus soli TaxID=1543965 RepID=A0A544SQK5_9BACI|nr:TRAP transporter small permease [Psychrobacillus soli]TQR07487.1 TRAP transporter small permease [Psychrobacillus soli]